MTQFLPPGLVPRETREVGFVVVGIRGSKLLKRLISRQEGRSVAPLHRPFVPSLHSQHQVGLFQPFASHSTRALAVMSLAVCSRAVSSKDSALPIISGVKISSATR